MKSTQIRKLVHIGLDGNQPINVRYVRKLREVTRGRVTHFEPTPEIARVDILLTAGQWRARYLERRRTQQKRARQLRRADRAGRAAKR